MSDKQDRAFEYLLNAMEAAAQSENPAAENYAAKRRAVFDYVRNLEADFVGRILWYTRHRTDCARTRYDGRCDCGLAELTKELQTASAPKS